jgi:hypothetical protein
VVSSRIYTFRVSGEPDNDNTIALAIAKDPVNYLKNYRLLRGYKILNYGGAMSFANGKYDTVICESEEVNGEVIPVAKNGNVYCAKGKEIH